jgi:hypothetical protein
MESSLSLSPAKPETDHIQNWLAVLREMDHLGKGRIEMVKKNQGLQTQLERLQASLEKVQKSNLSLRDEVASLKLWHPGHVAPQLAVEVVSPGHPFKDYVTAPQKYAASGTFELSRPGPAVPI